MYITDDKFVAKLDDTLEGFGKRLADSSSSSNNDHHLIVQKILLIVLPTVAGVACLLYMWGRILYICLIYGLEKIQKKIKEKKKEKEKTKKRRREEKDKRESLLKVARTGGGEIVEQIVPNSVKFINPEDYEMQNSISKPSEAVLYSSEFSWESSNSRYEPLPPYEPI